MPKSARHDFIRKARLLEQKTKTSCLFLDTSLGLSVAVRLGEAGWNVYYHLPSDGYPKFSKAASGKGFPVTKIEDFGEAMEEAEVIVATDSTMGRLVDTLTEQGKMVFGPTSRWTRMEKDRVYGFEQLKKMGFSLIPYTVVNGKEAVKKYLKKNNPSGDKTYYLKIDRYRGSMETSCVNTPEDVDIVFSPSEFGPYTDDLRIIVQESFEGMELGVDLLFNGKDFLRPYFYTPAVSELIGRWVETNGMESVLMDRVVDQLRKDQYRGAVSFEGFWDGRDFLPTDITPRFACPGWEIFAKGIQNLPEVIWKVAHGEDVRVEVPSPYMALNQLIVKESKDLWIKVAIPEEIADRVGFGAAVKKDDTVYVYPDPDVNYNFAFGVGFGQSAMEAIQDASRVCSLIHANGTFPAGISPTLEEDIRKVNEKCGADFAF